MPANLCEIVRVKNEFNDAVIAAIPGLQKKYHTFVAHGDGHVETICATLCRKSTPISYRRACITCEPDGGVVTLDWFHDHEKSLHPAAPVLIMLAGFTGGSQDPYMRLGAVTAREAGYRAVVVLARGCGGSPVTTPRTYSASDTGDLRQAIAHIRQLHPAAPLLAVGWSAGGNRLVHYLSQEGEGTPLVAALSLCNIWSLVYGDEHWKTGVYRMYDKLLTRKCKNLLRVHEPMFVGAPHGIDLAAAYRAKTLREYDQAVTVPMFGLGSVAEYYRLGSSCDVLHRVRVPLMCINALDDPLAPHQAIPRATFEQNPHTILVTTPTGGHLGWMAGPGAPFKNAWSDHIMVAYFDIALKLRGASQQQVPRSLGVAADMGLSVKGVTPPSASSSAGPPSDDSQPATVEAEVELANGGGRGGGTKGAGAVAAPAAAPAPWTDSAVADAPAAAPAIEAAAVALLQAAEYMPLPPVRQDAPAGAPLKEGASAAGVVAVAAANGVAPMLPAAAAAVTESVGAMTGGGNAVCSGPVEVEAGNGEARHSPGRAAPPPPAAGTPVAAISATPSVQ